MSSTALSARARGPKKHLFHTSDGLCGSAQIEYVQTLQDAKVRVNAVYLIDASGSMDGAPIRTAMQYVHNITRDVLDKEDRVSVFTFNEKLEEIWKDRKVRGPETNAAPCIQAAC